MASVGAKFCYLNKVCPKAFMDYLGKFVSPFKSSEFWQIVDRGQFDLERFAGAFREPVEKIKSLSGADFALPRDYANDRAPDFQLAFAKRLRFCPACAMLGFHAIFHQQLWFRKCLLHGIELQTLEPTSDEGRIWRSDLWNVTRTFALFFGETSGWSYQNRDSWTPSYDLPGWRIVSEYVDIARRAREGVILISNRLLAYYTPHVHGLHRSVESLRRHHLPEPLPEAIATSLVPVLVTDKPLRIRISSSRIGLSAVKVLPRESIDFARVARQWKRWSLVLGEETSWSRSARVCIDDLLEGHRGCWISFMLLRRCRLDDSPEFSAEVAHICSRVVFASKIQEHWLVPWHLSEERKLYGRDEEGSNEEHVIGGQLEAAGLAKRFKVPILCSTPDGEARPYIVDVWRPISAIRRFADFVLGMELVEEVWRYWEHENRLQRKEADESQPDAVACCGDWYLYESADQQLIFEAWTRHACRTPDWSALRNADHLDGKQTYEFAILHELARHHKLPLREQLARPDNAKQMALMSWIRQGYPTVKNWTASDEELN
jgi:hypothetical protein